MKLLLWIVIALVALVVVIAAIGSRLPKAHHASKTARFPVPPETLYAVISDVERYPEWRQDVKRVERLPDRDGRPAWIEHARLMTAEQTLRLRVADVPRMTREVDARIGVEEAVSGGGQRAGLGSHPP